MQVFSCREQQTKQTTLETNGPRHNPDPNAVCPTIVKAAVGTCLLKYKIKSVQNINVPQVKMQASQMSPIR